MKSRGRDHNQSNNWDDYDNATYDQYADDDGGSGNLDQCRLYITNIPKTLNEEGLRTAFSKYGVLTEAHVSRDPQKRYGLVSYETPGEAKLAMMKLNKTEPLRFNIAIAYKKKANNNRPREEKERRYRDDSSGVREEASSRDDVSVGSRGRNNRKRDLANGDNDMDNVPADEELELDADLHLELEQLKLEHLKLQEEQLMCKHRMILLKQAEKRTLTQGTSSNRCILPDGRIVVRTNNDRAFDSREAESSFGAGAGDSQLKIPGLQRVGSRACVSCGGDADSYCARCGVTPYCSPRCQRRDWNDRHRAICHNLARLSGSGGPDAKESIDNDSNTLPMAPLRRPHSPSTQKPKSNMRRDNDGNANQNGDTDRSKQKFMPPGQSKTPAARNNVATNSTRGGRSNFRQNDRRPKYDGPQEDDDWDSKPAKPSTQKTPEKEQPKPQMPAMAALRQPRVEPKPVQEKSQATVTPRQAVSQEKTQIVATRQPVSQEIQTATSRQPVGQSVLKEVKETGKLPSLDDVTPKKKMVPKNCLIELLSVGDTFLLSAENKTQDCNTKQPGLVCLSMHETQQDNYNKLCEDYVMHCEAQPQGYTPSPGEVFSYLNPEDGGWYRARALSDTLAALLDSCKVVPLKADDKCKKLIAEYEVIPEFSCVLNAGGAKIGANFQCTILSKTSEGLKVSLADVETGALAGEGVACRWMPDVEYPKSEPVQVKTAQPQIPEVKRPDVVNNSKVILIDATAQDKVYVRPADAASQRKYDSALADVLVYGTSATPMKEPPQKGQTVIGKFTGDGYFYRALCKRTNVKQNKYLLEYIEFGNVEITALENIYPCPPELTLDNLPTLASLVTLNDVHNVFTAPAQQYIDKLKDSAAELILTLPNGSKMAPSCSAVNLTIVKNNESVNKKIEDMSTPEWKKIEDSAGDVVAIQSYFIQDVEYLEIPAGGCELQILDIGSLGLGSVSGHVKGLPYADFVLNKLSDKMAEYCNSEIGKEPYLPKVEELCIAQCPPYPQWFRAVFLEQESPGSDEVRLCYLDYGNIECVSAKLLRKMMAEFIKDLPVLASLFEIKDFPKDPTQEMLARAIKFLKVDDEGRGVLRITSAIKQDAGMYVVEAPELVNAMNTA